MVEQRTKISHQQEVLPRFSEGTDCGLVEGQPSKERSVKILFLKYGDFMKVIRRFNEGEHHIIR